MHARQVADIFLERGLITPERAEDLIRIAETEHKPIEESILDVGVVDEQGFEQVIAESIGAEAYPLHGFEPDANTLGLIPSGLARLHGALPIAASGNTIFVALADPLNSQSLEDIRFALGRDIVQVVSFPSQVRNFIRDNYGSEDSSITEILSQLQSGKELLVEDNPDDSFNLNAVTAEANAAPIIKYVDLILDKAVA
ncbi:MAG: pilus assembly protein PilB, partial [Planctomycetes bacterium]|nr:pilus assembly protein PilB [Planctomycetota bacterium]